MKCHRNVSDTFFVSVNTDTLVHPLMSVSMSLVLSDLEYKKAIITKLIKTSYNY